MGSAEKVPLKSHMKLKPDRVLQLKKAAARYLLRGQNAGCGVQNHSPVADNDVFMAGPGEDSFYESDHNDNQTYLVTNFTLSYIYTYNVTYMHSLNVHQLRIMAKRETMK